MAELKAKITSDAKKLWECSNFRAITSKEHFGKLPKSAGQEVILQNPGMTPSPFCNAMRAWCVLVPPKDRAKYGAGYFVCEHQIDLEENK